MNTQERLDIVEALARQDHIVDRGELELLYSVFTADAIYDMSATGLPVMEGVDALRTGALRLGADNPVAHHVTNVIITRDDGDEADIDSKGLILTADGNVRSVSHHDLLRRTTAGWRIARRTIIPQRTPLGGRLDIPVGTEQ